MRFTKALPALVLLLALVAGTASVYISENPRQGLAPVSAESHPEPTARKPGMILGFELRFLGFCVRSGLISTDPYGWVAAGGVVPFFFGTPDSTLSDFPKDHRVPPSSVLPRFPGSGFTIDLKEPCANGCGTWEVTGIMVLPEKYFHPVRKWTWQTHTLPILPYPARLSIISLPPGTPDFVQLQGCAKCIPAL